MEATTYILTTYYKQVVTCIDNGIKVSDYLFLDYTKGIWQVYNSYFKAEDVKKLELSEKGLTIYLSIEE